LYEIEELKNDIINYSIMNDKKAGTEATYLSYLEDSFASCLNLLTEMHVVCGKGGIPIQIDEECYVRNTNSGESMFYDIVQMYKLKFNTTIKLKSIILKFCVKTLRNVYIVTGSHFDAGNAENSKETTSNNYNVG